MKKLCSSLISLAFIVSAHSAQEKFDTILYNLIGVVHTPQTSLCIRYGFYETLPRGHEHGCIGCQLLSILQSAPKDDSKESFLENARKSYIHTRQQEHPEWKYIAEFYDKHMKKARPLFDRQQK